MPIITIQFIKDVVANDEQKRELMQKMTDTFVSVVGDVVRPYTYCLIQETPQMEWAIAGKPMPDLAYLIGPDYRGFHAKANEIMANAIANAQAEAAKTSGNPAGDAAAEDQWKG
jgi:4-oxalocrotonate tautomerase